jgi:hypothetical protein
LPQIVVKQKMMAPIGELKVLISGWHQQLTFTLS